MKEIKYIISPVTLYDNDLEMYSTKVGYEGKNMPLLYSVWGNSEQESRVRAALLIDNLKKI